MQDKTKLEYIILMLKRVMFDSKNIRATLQSHPDCGCHFPWPHIQEGSGQADTQCGEKEKQLLRRMDPQKRPDHG